MVQPFDHVFFILIEVQLLVVRDGLFYKYPFAFDAMLLVQTVKCCLG